MVNIANGGEHKHQTRCPGIIIGRKYGAAKKAKLCAVDVLRSKKNGVGWNSGR